jgi:acetyltransferase-like isoleucine patch superfamily enzyme
MAFLLGINFYSKMKNIPKWLESIFTFYPLMQLASAILFFILFLKLNSIFWLMGLLFVVFFLSPLIWRLLKLCFSEIPLVSYIGKYAPHGNLWLISYQLQFIYNTFPVLESFLKFLPGFYSIWLRLWGNKIGKKINWAPLTYIVDRTHLELGDRLLIGNKTYITSHVLKKKDKKYFLFFKPVIIGDDSFISFSCTIGPGTQLPQKTFLKAFAVEYQTETRNNNSHDHNEG